MREFVALFCLFASALGFVLEPPALEKTSENSLYPNGRIIGGVKTDIRDVPYQVALEFSNNQYCGGVLVSEYYVLTAAHCQRTPHRSLKVRVGSSKRQKDGHVLPIEHITPHDKYNDKELDYDIAVIRLLQRAPLGTNVKPIKVADSNVEPGTKLKLSGWGLTADNGKIPDDLHSAEVEVIPNEECVNTYSLLKLKVTPRMLCAFSWGKFWAKGDDGGPAVANGVVYGIVSWTRPRNPGVYANITEESIRAFIREYAKV